MADNMGVNFPVGKVGSLDNQLVKERLKRPGFGVSFGDILQEQLQKNEQSAGVQFSKHARERIAQRGVDLTSTLMDSLNNAVEKARAKGARDIVLIGQKEAFIVNVPNNMVVTALQEREMKDSIFTNIDSAMIL